MPPQAAIFPMRFELSCARLFSYPGPISTSVARRSDAAHRGVAPRSEFDEIGDTHLFPQYNWSGRQLVENAEIGERPRFPIFLIMLQ